MDGLLGVEDFIQFVATLVVLVLVAVSTWIRKTIEKARQEEGKGKPVDVGKAVRQQLDKYMRAAGQLPPKAPPAPQPEAKPVPTAAPVAREPLAPAVAPRPAVVVRKKRRRIAPAPTVGKTVHRPSKFTPQDVKRAVVQAELLGPPLALRKDYRLF